MKALPVKRFRQSEFSWLEDQSHQDLGIIIRRSAVQVRLSLPLFILPEITLYHEITKSHVDLVRNDILEKHWEVPFPWSGSI